MDYYELLGVSETSLPDEIKLAYRKQALVWHPDKNPDNLEEATQKFKTINEAYSVLSDPHEKAWYDSHKADILTGSKSEDLNLWSYFSTSVFPGGFTDEPDGFFAVYDELFETLNKKENSEAKDKTKIVNRPKFGNSEATYDILKVFYAYWNNFTTSRGFTWADEYNTCEAPNRKVRRLMEVENTKERNKQRKAYNEMVVTLVDYVKKRDPRWIRFQEEARIEKLKKDEQDEITRKEDEIKKKEYLEAHRLKQAERYAKEYKEKMMHRNDSDSDIEKKASEEESETELLWCEICKKSFINQGQLNNHNNSKKHKQNVQKVIKEVQLPEEAAASKKPEPKKQNKKKNRNESPEEVKIIPEKYKNVNKHLAKHNQKPFADEEVKTKKANVEKKPHHSSEDEDSDADLNILKFAKAKKKVIDLDSDEEEIHKKPQKKQEKIEVKYEEKKVGKAKQKREKKKAAVTEFICRVCKSDFATKNKLFTHLQDSGHEKAQ